MSVIELADEEVDAFTASATTGAEVEVFAGAYVPEQPERPRVGCVVPACNEEASIESVLQALLNQTRIPDVIHVIINNTTDDTFWVARELAGRHERNYRDEKMVCDIRVHDVGRLPERKVGALNIGFKLVEDCDYLLGVDGDTVLARDAVANLLAEISSDSRIGGISAIYSIDYAEGRNGGEKFLIAGQRQQFASFNLQNLLRGRNMAVLGGQCSIFSVAALKTVRDAHRQHGPWVSDSEVEDSLLSQQLKRCGFSTKISASARAEVGPMVTLKSLDAQQVKWNYGAIDLMWPGQWGDTSGQPFHPNLRLRWLENWSMLFNLLVRIGFVLLLAASMSIGAFVFSPWWLLPPLVAIALNVRTALSMHDRTAKDIAFALLFLPGELYTVAQTRPLPPVLGEVPRSSRRRQLGRPGRSGGRKGRQRLPPAARLSRGDLHRAGAHLAGASAAGQGDRLVFAWPALAVLAAIQTVAMAVRLTRRHRGFRV